MKSKYSPQIGDIVVGRVVEIANKRWKIDINANSDSFLNLNSAYITELRKKNQEDEFNMRRIMQEGDDIVA
jgi:exosome complex component RRP4